jgi:hypothetical protein
MNDDLPDENGMSRSVRTGRDGVAALGVAIGWHVKTVTEKA